MAERVGFEPTLPFRVNTLSKRAPSATRPSLRRGCCDGKQGSGRTSACRTTPQGAASRTLYRFYGPQAGNRNQRDYISMEREFTKRRGENRACVLVQTVCTRRSRGRFYELLPFADAAAACTSGDAEPFACPFEESSAAFFSLSTTRWFRQ